MNKAKVLHNDKYRKHNSNNILSTWPTKKNEISYILLYMCVVLKKTHMYIATTNNNSRHQHQTDRLGYLYIYYNNNDSNILIVICLRLLRGRV
uniref:Uncharacterized protein n=1 Tax=Glossina palpalis gambiensis TaxID=67801 RepID=A0A1B0BL51_9MUSC